MAKEASFEIVSEVDLMEVENALGQAQKELAQRYDLKDSGSTLDYDKKNAVISVGAPSEFVAQQVADIVTSKLSKRGIDLGSIVWDNALPAKGARVKRTAHIQQGIPQDRAKRIAKDIRGFKIKVKAQVTGDKLRVSSASRDALQETIARLKEQDYGQPLQFTNYR